MSSKQEKRSIEINKTAHDPKIERKAIKKTLTEEIPEMENLVSEEEPQMQASPTEYKRLLQ